ncbi:hypothetical protein TNCV_3054751 [Trichonephila clavipes]|nr:hypothetical protein TNCV_3054751 [Trichonephila clavipes]
MKIPYGCRQLPPISLYLPPTLRKDLHSSFRALPCHEGTTHCRTSMTSPGFEPKPLRHSSQLLYPLYRMGR